MQALLMGLEPVGCMRKPLRLVHHQGSVKVQRSKESRSAAESRN